MVTSRCMLISVQWSLLLWQMFSWGPLEFVQEKFYYTTSMKAWIPMCICGGIRICSLDWEFHKTKFHLYLLPHHFACFMSPFFLSTLSIQIRKTFDKTGIQFLSTNLKMNCFFSLVEFAWARRKVCCTLTDQTIVGSDESTLTCWLVFPVDSNPRRPDTGWSEHVSVLLLSACPIAQRLAGGLGLHF